MFDLRKMLVISSFGFASGLPYILIFSTLSAWLRDVGINLSIIGFFSWIVFPDLFSRFVYHLLYKPPFVQRLPLFFVFYIL